ncbi:ABC transporter C family [Klebsormidium nitens]|uniref:ABC transporter C family n=1 Tax=Klebsormidium nitens TaxID=105231 RepID=A0A1Y1HYR1_KLENI|nr:ABC transporter C family [Klebsormidium nitens]|eukprot:GAQ81666.1 ABC transporter C family [Klebsormidium nitens]
MNASQLWAAFCSESPSLAANHLLTSPVLPLAPRTPPPLVPFGAFHHPTSTVTYYSSGTIGGASFYPVLGGLESLTEGQRHVTVSAAANGTAAIASVVGGYNEQWDDRGGAVCGQRGCQPADTLSSPSSSDWLAALVRSHCAQHALVVLMHVFFFTLVLIYRTLRKCCFRRVESLPYMNQISGRWEYTGRSMTSWRSGISLVPVPNYSTRYWLALILTSLGAAAYLIMTSWRLLLAWKGGFEHPHWGNVPVHEAAFVGAQCIAFFQMAGAVNRERQRGAFFHSPPMRAWWIANFLVSLFLAFLAADRIVEHNFHPGSYHAVDDCFNVATLPVTLCLAVIAYSGRTGISVALESSDHFREQLLDDDLEDGTGANGTGPEPEPTSKDPGVSQFRKAGLWSTLTFAWLNPLLVLGRQRPLEVDDIPKLSWEDRSDGCYQRFKLCWDNQKAEQPGQKPGVLKALFAGFWSVLVSSAALSLIKTAVMYAGPVLLNRLVEYTAGVRHFEGEGYVLVAVLFACKFLETITEHQYNFYCARLGMYVKSALTAAVYRKGLRLSSKARQSHTAGEIINYMATDAPRLSDTSYMLNDVWNLPLQVAIALVILFQVVGLSMLAGLATMVFIMTLNFIIARWQRKLQKALMEAKDKRMKATTESLNNMKIIKLHAWEGKYREKIEELRGQEFAQLSLYMYLSAGNIFLLWLSPLAVSVLTFTACVFAGTPLTVARVFTAIATFRILQEPLRSFPTLVTYIVQALVSVDRLNKYLNDEELQSDAVTYRPLTNGHVAPPEAPVISIKNGTFKWNTNSVEERPTLKDVNLEITAGSLVAVVGSVGSGKSSLLSCILGEVPKLGGEVTVRGSIAYVSQTAWIQNASIKDNILFGRPFDPERYETVVKVSALEKDLALMSHGDETEIGERGINLSGGQKQRIQIARAVYHDADTYLLDDPFSAVDAHTGTELFTECIAGALGQKTVVLVTHQVEFLPAADLIVVVKDGVIAESGSYEALIAKGTDLTELVAAHHSAMGATGEERNEGGAVESTTAETDDVLSEDMSDALPDALLPESPVHVSLERRKSYTLERPLLRNESGGKPQSPRKPGPFKATQAQRKAAAQLVQEEEKETGRVDPGVYIAYATKVLRGAHVPALILIQIAWQGLQISSDWWLAHSTSEESTTNPRHFIGVYALLAMSSGIFVLFRSTLIAFSGLATAKAFFDSMLHAVFRAPMAFFDSTPSGRILNRSSNDQGVLDSELPFRCGSTLALGFQLFGVMAVVCAVTPSLLLVVLPLAFIYIQLGNYFLHTSRELTRIDSVTKSPVIHHFSESINGAMTIRAFNQEERFARTNLTKLDNNLKNYFHFWGTNEWLGVRLEMIGTVVLSAGAFFLVVLPSTRVDAGLVGLSLSYGLSLNNCIFWAVLLFCTLENKMVSVERIQQYTKLESEAPAVVDVNRPPKDWPRAGSIQFHDLEVRYRPDLPPVLHSINLAIEAGEKIGIVGRTGSGKSTLITALFRLVEPSRGNIVIDGVNVLRIGLADLRSRIGIIPQDPVLFAGTVRSNMDPLGEHSDVRIWEALEKSALTAPVREKGKGLDADVGENGENWSVGQRQLFCLGRALLKSVRILCLDEATASVDTATDALIQRTIWREFEHCTVLSVAHRIPTVIDSDRVLVMEAGLVREFDSPTRLLEDKTSLFSKLVQEYSSRSSSVANLAALQRRISSRGNLIDL